jgi:hypothetical protein
LLVTDLRVDSAFGLVTRAAIPITYTVFLLVAERVGKDLSALAAGASSLVAGVPVMVIACLSLDGGVRLPPSGGAGSSWSR